MKEEGRGKKEEGRRKKGRRGRIGKNEEIINHKVIPNKNETGRLG